VNNRASKYVVGVDEVGRGPLAGPITVCAFVIPRKNLHMIPKHVLNSKKLSEKKREEYYKGMNSLKKGGHIDIYVASVSAQVIDRDGITKATKKAIRRALRKVDHKKAEVLLDGLLYAPKRFEFQRTIIKGDEKERVIALASIMAKVVRDRKMTRYEKKFPGFELGQHKGYGTALHIKKIKKNGPSEIHRKSFLSNIS